MEIKDIKALIDAAKETDYTYIKIKSKDVVIELSKEQVVNHPAPRMMPQMPIIQESLQKQVIETQITEAPTVVEDSNLHIVTSPIVGTYYASSTPESAPFVKVGDNVAANQTLCIIEAMKLMNEIDTEVCGKIVEILVTNEETVEYGQPLFKIKKD